MKVFIIVPVYNIEKCIHSYLNCFLNQTYKDFGISLVDDSPDKYPEICNAYSKKDRRIGAIHKKIGGLSSSCNTRFISMISFYISAFIQFVIALVPDKLKSLSFIKLLRWSNG